MKLPLPHRWLLSKVTGDPLTKQERKKFNRLADMYEFEHIRLRHREFQEFKRLWKIDNRYN